MPLLRDGRNVRDRRVDRIPAYDEASRNFQVRALHDNAAAAGTSPPRRTAAHRPAKPVLDQGNLGGCVLWSEATGENASPHRRKPPTTDDEARARYFAVQLVDEYPGGEYAGATPKAGGTSLLAAAKLAQAEGRISSYWWCGAGSGRAIDDLVDSLVHPDLGGVQLGIPWYESMYWPDPYGLLAVDPSSGQTGMHAYHAIWAHSFRYAPIPGHGRARREHVVVQQTWGTWGVEWFGVPGHAFVLVEDVEAKLLPREVYGEAMVPVP